MDRGRAIFSSGVSLYGGLPLRWGEIRQAENNILSRFKGGPGSGHHGHAGRPGKQGGSSPSPGLLATGSDQELYRWGNLREVVELSRGKRIGSLDVSNLSGFYFAPPSAEPRGRGWPRKVYGRFILDRQILADGGWSLDPHLRAEGAWRYRGRASEREIIRNYLRALCGYEVHEIPEGQGLKDIAAILEYRLGRKIPGVYAEGIPPGPSRHG